MGQTLRGVAAASLLSVLVASPFAAAAQVLAERKIEGTVLRVKVTVCERRARGCAGYLILEPGGEQKGKQVMVQVRLGVPIRYEEDYLYLAALGGSAVSVTYVTEKGAVVARSIEVLKKASSSGGAAIHR